MKKKKTYECDFVVLSTQRSRFFFYSLTTIMRHITSLLFGTEKFFLILKRNFLRNLKREISSYSSFKVFLLKLSNVLNLRILNSKTCQFSFNFLIKIKKKFKLIPLNLKKFFKTFKIKSYKFDVLKDLLRKPWHANDKSARGWKCLRGKIIKKKRAHRVEMESKPLLANNSSEKNVRWKVASDCWQC